MGVGIWVPARFAVGPYVRQDRGRDWQDPGSVGTGVCVRDIKFLVSRAWDSKFSITGVYMVSQSMKMRVFVYFILPRSPFDDSPPVILLVS